MPSPLMRVGPSSADLELTCSGTRKPEVLACKFDRADCKVAQGFGALWAAVDLELVMHMKHLNVVRPEGETLFLSKLMEEDCCVLHQHSAR